MLSIRAMAAGDLEQVLAIAAAAGAPQWPRSVYQGILNSDSAADPGPAAFRRFALVCHPVCAELRLTGDALAGGMLAGFGVVSLLRPERSAELEIVAVRPELQRRGIGATLMRSLLEAARQGAAQTIRLEVRPSNSAAIALYRGQGFGETGRRPGYYSAPAEDALIFEADLLNKS